MELPTSADLKVKRRLVTELLEHRPGWRLPRVGRCRCRREPRGV